MHTCNCLWCLIQPLNSSFGEPVDQPLPGVWMCQVQHAAYMLYTMSGTYLWSISFEKKWCNFDFAHVAIVASAEVVKSFPNWPCTVAVARRHELCSCMVWNFSKLTDCRNSTTTFPCNFCVGGALVCLVGACNELLVVYNVGESSQTSVAIFGTGPSVHSLSGLLVLLLAKTEMLDLFVVGKNTPRLLVLPINLPPWTEFCLLSGQRGMPRSPLVCCKVPLSLCSERQAVVGAG